MQQTDNNKNNNKKYRIVLEGAENTNPFEELIKIFLRPDQYTITNTITETHTGDEMPAGDEMPSNDPASREGEASVFKDNSKDSSKDGSVDNSKDSSKDGSVDNYIDSSIDGSIDGSNKELLEETLEETLLFQVDEDKDVTRRQIFECLSAKTGMIPKWGIMTGIRPVKLYGMLIDEFAGKTDEPADKQQASEEKSLGQAGCINEETQEKARNCFRQHYLVSEEKTKLTAEMYAYQMDTFGSADDDSCGIYIGIPFCPTRCLYCSFASNPADDEIIKKYLEALHREIEYCGTAMKENGFYAESIYIGGGTPTTLTADQLDELLQHVTDVIPAQPATDDTALPAMDDAAQPATDDAAQPAMDDTAQPATDTVPAGISGSRIGSALKEFTVEAGRPDTITEEKIKVMLSHGVGRISINPQTMNGETLKTIGRDHTPEDVRRAFEIVRRAEEEYRQQCSSKEDFRSRNDQERNPERGNSRLQKLIINTDLIAGLPGEDVSDMENSIAEMIDLGADNITVHSLAVKRASRLSEEDKDYHYSRGEVVSEMLERAQEMLRESAYIPYYLYRQKHMSGAQENTGYCKEGTASIYNVRIMDEHQRIIAMGAGGISKAYDPRARTLERVPNVTNQEIYTDRIDEMIRRKKDKLFK